MPTTESKKDIDECVAQVMIFIVDRSERSERRSTLYISLGGLSAPLFAERVDPIGLQHRVTWVATANQLHAV